MTRNTVRMMAAAAFLTVAGAGLTAFAWPQAETKAGGDKAAQAPDADMGMALMMGLKSTPGCLGIDAGETMSGKNVIFAWFEDKKAAMRWYHSETHQMVMDRFFPDHESHEGYEDDKPMAGVPDGVPILAIASVTMSDEANLDETSLPISQIAIELYTPVSGGLHLGGRFAPESVKVKNMTDYSPKE